MEVVSHTMNDNDFRPTGGYIKLQSEIPKYLKKLVIFDIVFSLSLLTLI